MKFNLTVDLLHEPECCFMINRSRIAWDFNFSFVHIIKKVLHVLFHNIGNIVIKSIWCTLPFGGVKMTKVRQFFFFLFSFNAKFCVINDYLNALGHFFDWVTRWHMAWDWSDDDGDFLIAKWFYDLSFVFFMKN